jgi:hypothetical protein
MVNDRIILIVLSFILGFIVCKLLLKPEYVESYKTTFTTDTVFVDLPKDTVYLTRTKIKHQIIRDTVLINFEPKISHFKALYPVLNGNIHVEGEVLGEVLKMGIITDLKQKVITNTIERETIKTYHMKGLYLGGQLHNSVTASLNLDYLNKNLKVGYSYNPVIGHGVGIGVKIF